MSTNDFKPGDRANGYVLNEQGEWVPETFVPAKKKGVGTGAKIGGQSTTRPHLIPSTIAALMLLMALGAHPYGYYTALRWVVFGSALQLVWVLSSWHARPEPESPSGWKLGVGVFALIALLFNPLLPVYLDRGTWAPIDLFSCAAFAIAAVVVRRPSAASLLERR